jgi:hypothetical protein
VATAKLILQLRLFARLGDPGLGGISCTIELDYLALWRNDLKGRVEAEREVLLGSHVVRHAFHDDGRLVRLTTPSQQVSEAQP